MIEVRRWVSPLVTKLFVIGLLVLLLLILIAQVEGLVGERVNMRRTAAERVAESWGGAQTTGAVLLAIPVDMMREVIEQTVGRETKRTEVVRHTLYVLPDRLAIAASAKPDRRRVGLYETPVYLADVSIRGEFAPRDFEALRVPREDAVVKWDEARLLVLNSESRALRAVDNFLVAGARAEVAAGSYADFAGVSTAMPVAALRDGAAIPFEVDLKLAGSERLSFLPLARTATVSVGSQWPHPKFEGGPAPLDPRIGDDGFSASWSVLEINRSFGQSWWNGEVREGASAAAAFAQSAVGVTLYEPVDVYQRNYRAVHYAALLIIITFLTFFLWEHVSGIVIHAMQYLMVGLALAMFYLLLLALSEHVVFVVAYATSAGALVALITVYLAGALRRWSLAVGAGAGLATLYAMLFWILRSEDYSLLMGALLLFVVLVVLMLATRRLDWGNVARREA
jgi:inner membrane protein